MTFHFYEEGLLQVVHQFEILTGITPKAFANFSPGFEEREPWDKNLITTKP